jgi:beta-lactam-binding protein with PASTA domain
MRQQYKAGKKLSEGQTVGITISDGPQDKTSTVSIDIDFSNAPADTFKLYVILVQKDGNESTIIDGRDSLKASGGATVNVRGTGTGAKVLIYFDDKLVRTARVNFNTGAVSG